MRFYDALYKFRITRNFNVSRKWWKTTDNDTIQIADYSRNEERLVSQICG